MAIFLPLDVFPALVAGSMDALAEIVLPLNVGTQVITNAVGILGKIGAGGSGGAQRFTMSAFDTHEDHLPQPHTPDTTVSIAVGLESPGRYKRSHESAVDVRLWNVFGQLVGPPQVDYTANADNTKFDIHYKHFKDREGQLAPYATFTGNDHAICVAWTAITWPDGRKHVASGDWARVCGAPWAFSNLSLGTEKSGDYAPACAWIDKHGDVNATAFQVSYPALSPRPDGSVPDQDVVCNTEAYMTSHESVENHTLYQFRNWGEHLRAFVGIPAADHHNDVIDHSSGDATGTTGNSTKHQQTRQREKRLSVVDNRLIITPRPQHRASELCDSDTSRGPSVVSLDEGTFCDMTTKTLYPLCHKGSGYSYCFDETTWSVEEAHETGRVIAKRTKNFSFSEVLDWTKGDAANA